MNSYSRFFSTLFTGLLLAGTVLGQDIADKDVAGKQALAEQVLELWHVENTALAVFQKTGADVLRNTNNAIRGRLPSEQQEVVMGEVARDVEAYLVELAPFVRAQAESVKPTFFLPFLLENFNEEELEDLVRILKSPAKKKLDELLPTIQREYEQKVVEESSSRVKPELIELTAKVNATLQAAVAP